MVFVPAQEQYQIAVWTAHDGFFETASVEEIESARKMFRDMNYTFVVSACDRAIERKLKEEASAIDRKLKEEISQEPVVQTLPIKKRLRDLRPMRACLGRM